MKRDEIIEIYKDALEKIKRQNSMVKSRNYKIANTALKHVENKLLLKENYEITSTVDENNREIKNIKQIKPT